MWKLKLTMPKERNSFFHFCTIWVAIDMCLNIAELCPQAVKYLLKAVPSAFKCMWQVRYLILPSNMELANL
jgi:hypothetical protein